MWEGVVYQILSEMYFTTHTHAANYHLIQISVLHNELQTKLRKNNAKKCVKRINYIIYMQLKKRANLFLDLRVKYESVSIKIGTHVL